MSKTRYGKYSSGYGAAALLLTYTLVQTGVIPEADVPLITEATGTVIGAVHGLLHAHLTSDGTEQQQD